MPFAYITWGQLRGELQTRLNDTNVFWTNAECGLYLALAMREWNCLTAFWVSEYAVTLTPPFASNWFAADAGTSPRLATLSNNDIYTLMQYMLMEPATGGLPWTGTSQFSLADLTQAVQGRLDESLQIGATNLAEITVTLPAGNNRVTLPDTVLDVRRVRYVPTIGSPVTLQRGDSESFRVFTPNYLQTTKAPLRWDVISGPPLTLIVDTNAPVGATLQLIVMQSVPLAAAPTATPLGLPDDWTWVLLFGALADALSTQEESRDAARAEYCRKRYTEGLEMLRAAPWLLEARIDNVARSTPSVSTADRFSYEWQSNAAAFQQVVVAGTDLYAVSPVPTVATAVTLVVVANAPIPTADGTTVQVPRDVIDAILDEAEHLAVFKRGAGPEFVQSLALHESFLGTTKRWNARIRESGIFPTTLRPKEARGEVQQPRFALPGKE